MISEFASTIKKRIWKSQNVDLYTCKCTKNEGYDLHLHKCKKISVDRIKKTTHYRFYEFDEDTGAKRKGVRTT